MVENVKTLDTAQEFFNMVAVPADKIRQRSPVKIDEFGNIMPVDPSSLPRTPAEALTRAQ